MVRKHPPDEGPKERPEKPSNPAKLRYQGRRKFLWPLIFVLNLASLAMWYLGSGAFWIWHHRRLTAKWIGVLFWRGATLLGVVYLVYDRVYEADATLSASASDPAFAFEFPFAITNNSHIFTIRNVKWSCNHIRARWQTTIADNNQIIAGTAGAIEPGRTLNFDCSLLGPNSRIIRSPKVKMDEAMVRIDLSYDADFFGWFTLRRTPLPVTFRWWGDASNPQWIRGDFTK